jgi:muramoyltetrapeptide carboxypeptidase
VSIVRPPRLAPGDPIRLVAPSGPVPREELEEGARILARRYRVRYDPATLFQAEGFLAGSDEHRASELNAALRDPQAKAVVMARGGYGLTRILPFIDAEALRTQPKALVGFSDGTALCAAAYQAGLASVHGPVVTQVPRLAEEDLQMLYGLLERPGQGLLLEGLTSVIPGRAQGPLLGGNLEVFSRLLGTPYLPDPTGAVLFFEEIGERPYRVDRLLTHLDLAGVFSVCAAVICGEFLRCDEPPESGKGGPTVQQVLEERLGRLAVPVVFDAPIGHGTRNTPLPYGTLVELDTRHERLVALEGAVS